MSNGRRIVFVAPFGLRHKSTVWARALPLARELNQLGYTTRILVPPWDSPEDAGTHIIRDRVHIEHVELEHGIAGTSLRLLQRIKALSPEIVHIIKPRAYAGIVQWLLWQLRWLPYPAPRIVLDVDDWERPWATINGYPRLQAAFLQWQEEWGIRHADGITAASRWLADRVSLVSPSIPTLYLPNGIKPVVSTISRSYELRTPPRVLLLSRFVEVSPEWLSACWRAIHKVRSDAVLFVAGQALRPNGETPYLKALMDAPNNGSGGSAVWIGYVEPDDLESLFAPVDCAIFPSDGSPLQQAKCSVRLAQVLQHGVPTIASAVGEQSNYGMEGAARLVSPSAKPEEFAREVCEVLNDKELRESLGVTAMARMQAQFLWPTFGRKLADFYSMLDGESVACGE